MASASLSYCAEQARRFDNDRFVCSLFAPAAEREALAALCAFNIEVARIREAVREPLLGHMRLRWWSDTLDAVYAGRPPPNQVAVALAEAVRQYAVDRAHLDRLLEGRAFDLEDTAPPTLAALISYAEATSASLSAAGLQILGVTNGDAQAAARDVGIAWALVGLSRAVPFHARSRRLYLPADLCRDAGVDMARLFDRGVRQGLPQVVQQVLTAADAHLRRARERRSAVPAAALPVLLPAALAGAYIRRLERAGFDPFDPALQAPSPFRLAKVMMARLRKRY